MADTKESHGCTDCAVWHAAYDSGQKPQLPVKPAPAQFALIPDGKELKQWFPGSLRDIIVDYTIDTEYMTTAMWHAVHKKNYEHISWLHKRYPALRTAWDAWDSTGGGLLDMRALLFEQVKIIVACHQKLLLVPMTVYTFQSDGSQSQSSQFWVMTRCDLFTPPANSFSLKTEQPVWQLPSDTVKGRNHFLKKDLAAQIRATVKKLH